jgi:hypothetical protein
VNDSFTGTNLSELTPASELVGPITTTNFMWNPSGIPNIYKVLSMLEVRDGEHVWKNSKCIKFHVRYNNKQNANMNDCCIFIRYDHNIFCG